MSLPRPSSPPASASRSLDERPYVAITADTHAGAAIDAYREYLDPDWRAEFDAWRGSYRNPSEKHVGGKKTKNWDSAERKADLERDGVVGEVIFPNTVPPFYANAFHVSPPPSPAEYRRARAGTRAHNRWLAEFCAEEPARRAGIGLIHLNDIDDAIEDVRWIAEHGLRGGVLLPLPSPSEGHLKPLNDPIYDQAFNEPNSPWFQMFTEAVYNGNIAGALKTGQAGFEAVARAASDLAS